MRFAKYTVNGPIFDAESTDRRDGVFELIEGHKIVTYCCGRSKDHFGTGARDVSVVVVVELSNLEPQEKMIAC